VLLPSARLFFQRNLASLLSLALPAADMRRLPFPAGFAALARLMRPRNLGAAIPLPTDPPSISAATKRAAASLLSRCAMYSCISMILVWLCLFVTGSLIARFGAKCRLRLYLFDPIFLTKIPFPRLFRRGFRSALVAPLRLNWPSSALGALSLPPIRALS